MRYSEDADLDTSAVQDMRGGGGGGFGGSAAAGSPWAAAGWAWSAC